MSARLAVVVVAVVLAGGCAGAEPAATPTPTPLVSSPVASSASTAPASPAASPTPAVADASPSPGPCLSGQEGLVASSIALDRTLEVDGTGIPLTTAGIRNRSGDAQADDAIPAWASLTSETPTVSAPAGSEGRLAGSPRLRLVSSTLAAFPASGFDLSAGRFPDASSVTPRPLGPASGSLTFAYPSKVGRWVLAFGVSWQSTCLEGDGVAYVFATTR